MSGSVWGIVNDLIDPPDQQWSPLPHQVPPPGKWYAWMLLGGRGCIAKGTPIYNPLTNTTTPVERLTHPHAVLSMTEQGPRVAMAMPAYRKGQADLFRIRTATGNEIVVTGAHRFLSRSGWTRADQIGSTTEIATYEAAGVQHEWQTGAGCLDGCHPCIRSCDAPLLQAAATAAVNCKPIGYGGYYDFTVPEYHNYYAQGMFHHNSGKTHAASRHIHDIVYGPPMVSGVPGGHWISIVAPTLGDAVTSCVNGPSGLRKWDPGIKVIQQAGGTIVRWSNGVEGKLFGASTPEDVERFRAGGNRCVAAGTLVETEAGPLPIELVTPGMRVQTHAGLRPVTHCWDNGLAPVYRLTMGSGRSVMLTGNHMVMTYNRGIVAVQDLTPGDRLATWRVVQNTSLHLQEDYQLDIASLVGSGSTTWHGKQQRMYASSVEARLSQHQDTRIKSDSVASCVATGVRGVYDLTVEDQHEFFANGIGVLNSLCWLEEAAAFRYLDEAFQQIRYGLRTGMWPHMIITTTPKPRKLIRQIVSKAKEAALNGDVDAEYVITRASTKENPFLDQRIRSMLYEDYEGTRLGRQELGGEVLEDVEGALWSESMIENTRMLTKDYPTHLDYTVVAVDPQAKEGSTETGVVVVGFMRNYSMSDTRSHGFVLADLSVDTSPMNWGNVAINAYYDYDADVIVGERNNGGDMVRHIIQSIDDRVPYRDVVATKGKGRRAEPVANLFEQGRCIAEDVLVQTDRGPIPIQLVKIGDRVWTRDGLRTVLWAGMTGIKPTVEVTDTLGNVVRCTADHPILVDDEWVHAGLTVPKSGKLTAYSRPMQPRLPTARPSVGGPTGIVSVKPSGVQRVYDLTVDEKPEFFAGNILVHNCHLVGVFPKLEDQMLNFQPLDDMPASDSPDRMDAMVWGITETMIAHSQIVRREMTDTRLRGTR